MPSTTAFESRAAQIDKSIDREVATIRAREPLALADRDSPIVKDYVQKIEGVYNDPVVTRCEGAAIKVVESKSIGWLGIFDHPTSEFRAGANVR